MKKQIFTIIILLMGGVSTFGQSFKLDATGTNDIRLRTSATDRLTILPNGKVGFGTTTPNTTLDVKGDFSMSKRILNLNVTGQINNLDLQGAAVHKYEGGIASSVTITGIAGGTEGKIVILYTSSSNTITLKHLSTSSLDINRILTNTLADVTVTNGAISLIYDDDSNCWRILYTTF